MGKLQPLQLKNLLIGFTVMKLWICCWNSHFMDGCIPAGKPYLNPLAIFKNKTTRSPTSVCCPTHKLSSTSSNLSTTKQEPVSLERFLNDCWTTNTKLIPSTNRNRSKQRDESIRTPSNYFKAREKSRIHGAIDFVFSLVKKTGATLLSQSLSMVIAIA